MWIEWEVHLRPTELYFAQKKLDGLTLELNFRLSLGSVLVKSPSCLYNIMKILLKPHLPLQASLSYAQSHKSQINQFDQHWLHRF